MRLRAGQGAPNASTSDLSNSKQAKWVPITTWSLHITSCFYDCYAVNWLALFYFFPFIFRYLHHSSPSIRNHPWTTGKLCVMFVCFGSASGVAMAPPNQTAGQAGPPRRGSASKDPPTRLKKWNESKPTVIHYNGLVLWFC